MAIADFTKAIDLNPNDPTAYFRRGVAYINKGFKDVSAYPLAIADFTKVIELNPDDAKAYDNRGYAYALSGQYTLAVTDLNKALLLSKDQETTDHALRILSQINQPMAPPSSSPTSPPTTSEGQITVTGVQVWELTELGRGQIARVLVYAGVFSETTDSPGWWMFDGAGQRLFKLPLKGNIFPE